MQDAVPNHDTSALWPHRFRRRCYGTRATSEGGLLDDSNCEGTGPALTNVRLCVSSAPVLSECVERRKYESDTMCSCYEYFSSFVSVATCSHKYSPLDLRECIVLYEPLHLSVWSCFWQIRAVSMYEYILHTGHCCSMPLTLMAPTKLTIYSCVPLNMTMVGFAWTTIDATECTDDLVRFYTFAYRCLTLLNSARWFVHDELPRFRKLVPLFNHSQLYSVHTVLLITSYRAANTTCS